MLLNTCKPIESTNNFYMWRAIFDKLICEDTLERLEKRSASVGVSTKSNTRASGKGRGSELRIPAALDDLNGGEDASKIRHLPYKATTFLIRQPPSLYGR